MSLLDWLLSAKRRVLSDMSLSEAEAKKGKDNKQLAGCKVEKNPEVAFCLVSVCVHLEMK